MFSVEKLYSSITTSIYRRIIETYVVFIIITLLFSILGYAISVTRAGFELIHIRDLLIFGGIWLSILAFISLFCVVWISRQALNPLRHLISWIKNTQSLEEISFSKDFSQEVWDLFSLVNGMLERLNTIQQSLIAAERDAAIGQLSLQVAHDIRSPLLALTVVESDLNGLSEDKRMMIRTATARIRDIANHLLNQQSQSQTLERAFTPVPRNETAEAAPQLLIRLIDSILTEKRMQYRPRSGLTIQSRMEGDVYPLFAQVQSSELKRVISNLIDNAVEASGETGEVTLVLRPKGKDGVEIQINDLGRGIPKELISDLGLVKKSFGKAGGSGLGLYHARKSCESWGGKLKVASKIGEGTQVTMQLPRVTPANWFAGDIRLKKSSVLAVFDDDESVHQVWQSRVDTLSLSQQGISLVRLTTFAEANRFVNRAEEQGLAVLYLIDYEILGSHETGLDLIEEIGIQDQSILVTSHFEDPHVLQQSRRLGVRILPKRLIPLVPFMVDPI